MRTPIRKVDIVLASVGALIVVVGTVAMFATDTEDKTVKKATVSKVKQVESEEPLQKIVKKEVATPVSVREKLAKSEKPTYFIKEDVKVEDAFEYVSVDDLNVELPHRENVEPIGAFMLKVGTIKNLRKGDSIVLPEINNVEYELKVTERTTNADGSITSTAKIEGEDSINFSLMTESDNTAFMTINSAEGTFQVEVFDGKGYVYAMNDIKQANIDYTKTDELNIPSSEDHDTHNH